MLGAIASFSSMAVAGRAVGQELDTFELMMYRSLIGIVIVTVLARRFGTFYQIGVSSLGLHMLRNLSHFAGQNLWFAALTMIPLAQLFALEFTSPIWVALLAPLFLNEKLTRLRIFVALMGFTGILIVARPDFANPQVGVILAALSAIGFAGSAIFTKKLTRITSITCILFWLTVMQAVFGVICAGWDGDIAWPGAAVWPFVAIVAVAGLCAHFCLTSALSLAPAVVVIPFDFARLPVIALIGMAFYGEALDLWVLLGAALIFGANYLNIAKETRR
ncbi:MAG: DMT family transporter [Litoreibacter sp.]|nr:DMT family transporter [Litoreibacter sp.]